MKNEIGNKSQLGTYVYTTFKLLVKKSLRLGLVTSGDSPKNQEDYSNKELFMFQIVINVI